MTEPELREWAAKVERVFDFLIKKGHEEKADVKDINVLHKLREQAADIATGKEEIETGINGLADAVGVL